jgi:GT2 family glycosyltransferase
MKRVYLNILQINTYIIMIPVIGILTMLKYELVERLINSIDTEVGEVVLISQGNEPEKIEMLREIIRKRPSCIKKIRFIIASYNIGVSTGWNEIIRQIPDAPYWVICGDDAYFEPGSLANIDKHMTEEDKYKDAGIIGFNMKRVKNGEMVAGGYCSFIFTQTTVEKVGLFDENIYPAYCEDGEHWMKIRLSGCKAMHFPDVLLGHGDDKFTGSCTINYVSDDYRRKMQQCQANNREYYIKKWGNERYKFPFNDDSLDIKHQPSFDMLRYNNMEILLGHKNDYTFDIEMY